MSEERLAAIIVDYKGRGWKDETYCIDCRVSMGAPLDDEAFVGLPHETWCRVGLAADLAAGAARIGELEAAGKALYVAFVSHRTATHVVQPKFCQTCRESDEALARWRAALERPVRSEGAGDV